MRHPLRFVVAPLRDEQWEKPLKQRRQKNGAGGGQILREQVTQIRVHEILSL